MTYSVPFSHNPSVDGYALKYKASTGLFEPQPSEAPPLNPKDFGCPWDGIHDDLPGFQAMLATIPTVSTNYRGNRYIELPVGMGYFSDNLRITKPVTINARNGGDDQFASGIYFPPGRGLYIDSQDIGDISNDASFVKIQNISLRSNLMQYWQDLGSFGGQGIGLGLVPVPYDDMAPQRTDKNFYEKGICANRGSVANNVCFFRVLVGGVTAGTTPNATTHEPAGFASTIAGVTFTDGAVTWVSEMYPKDFIANHSYRVGDRIFIPGDNRHYFECITAGTSGPSFSSNANYNFPLYLAETVHGGGQDHFADGPDTLVLRTRSHSGLVIGANNCQVENVLMWGFTNCASYAYSTSSTPNAYSDFTHYRMITVFYCGMGIHLSGGFNTNACTINNLNVFQCGLGRTILNSTFGNGGHAIWDKGLRNECTDCYAQFTDAPAYYASGNSTCTFINCDSENAPYTDLFQGGNNVIIRQALLGINSASSSAMIFDYGGGGWNTQNSFVSPSLIWKPGLSLSSTQPFAEGHGTSDQPYNDLHWEYQANRGNAVEPPAVAGTGWWGKMLGANTNRIFLGESQYPATEGPGHWRDYWGHFAGLTAPAYYNGMDITAVKDSGIRAGQRIIGDRFAIRNSGNVGTYDQIIVTSPGYIGIPWATNMSASQVGISVFAGFSATMVEPTGNIKGVDIVGQTGVSGNISSVVSPFATVTGLIGMTPQSISHVLTITGAGVGNNNGTYKIASYISPTSVIIINPIAAVTNGFSWKESLLNGIILSDNKTVVSGPGQKVFRCTTTGPTVGATEPNWSTATTIGNTIVDGYATWTYIGNTATYAFDQFISDQSTAQMPQTRSLWSDGYMNNAAITAPKSASASFRSDGYTSTNTANQTIFNIDNALFIVPLASGSLVDNAEYHVELLITCKTQGSHSETGSAKISADFYRDSGPLVRIGSDVNTPNFLSGSTCRININTNTLDIQVSPGVSAALGWTIIGTVVRKID